jgi:hypothetical protein
MAPIIDPLDELQQFGGAPSYKSQDLKLETERIKADTNAFDLLRRAQAAQRGDMTPSQGIASALLAAIPTLGGYLIGKSVGAPKMPEGVYFKGMGVDDFGKIAGASGGASGGLAGLQVGLDNQEKYKNSILEDPKILAAQAAIEAKRGEALQNDQSQLVQAGLAQDREDSRLGIKGAQDLANIRATGEESRKTVLARDATGEMTPEEEAAQARILNGKEQPGDFSMLSPRMQRITTERLKAQTTQDRLNLSADIRNQNLSFAENNDTVILDPSGRDPTLNRPRAELRVAKNEAMSAVRELASSYDKTSGSYFGIDAVKEAALASRLYSAGRLLAGTGASLTGNEGAVITAISAPNITVNGISDFLRRYLQSSGDVAAATREVEKALLTGFEVKMNGYGQGFKEFHPDKVQKTAVPGVTSGGFSEDAIKKKMAEIAAREAANGNR